MPLDHCQTWGHFLPVVDLGAICCVLYLPFAAFEARKSERSRSKTGCAFHLCLTQNRQLCLIHSQSRMESIVSIFGGLFVCLFLFLLLP